MLQPVPVLPSNASPLEGSNGRIRRQSRVLQEHPGNRQYNGDSPYPLEQSQKPASASNENNLAGNILPSSHYPAVAFSRSTWNRGRSGGHHDEEENIRASTTRLYQRFHASDAYVKYRTRQRTSKQNSHEQKWPDDLELAFIEALVRLPTMGKHKRFHKGKARGHNELISDVIEEVAGQRRNRKQISSHIQVLKPFFRDDPLITYLLSNCDSSGPNKRYHSALRAATFPSSGRRLSTYPSARLAPSPYSRHSHHHRRRHSPPDLDHHSLSPVWLAPDMFHPTLFEMFVQRRFPGREDVQRLHTYTSSSPSTDQSSSPPLQIPDFPALGTDLPLLAHMHARQPLGCNVFLASASVALAPETWRAGGGHASSRDVELGILFLCGSARLPARTRVLCRNSFYRGGRYLAEESGRGGVFTAVLEERGDGATAVEAQLKFGSAFWARTLAALAAKARGGAAAAAASFSSASSSGSATLEAGSAQATLRPAFVDTSDLAFPAAAAASDSSSATSPTASSSHPSSFSDPSSSSSAPVLALNARNPSDPSNSFAPGTTDPVTAELAAHLSSITVCQEFLIPTATPAPDPHPSAPSRRYDRLAVILWTFSLAPPGAEGRTSWRRVILPNPSPPPSSVPTATTPAPTAIPTLPTPTAHAPTSFITSSLPDPTIPSLNPPAPPSLPQSSFPDPSAAASAPASWFPLPDPVPHPLPQGLASPFHYAAPPAGPELSDAWGGVGVGSGVGVDGLGGYGGEDGSGVSGTTVAEPGMRESGMGEGGGGMYPVGCGDSLDLQLDFGHGMGFGDLGFAGMGGWDGGEQGLGFLGGNDGGMDWEGFDGFSGGQRGEIGGGMGQGRVRVRGEGRGSGLEGVGDGDWMVKVECVEEEGDGACYADCAQGKDGGWYEGFGGDGFGTMAASHEGRDHDQQQLRMAHYARQLQRLEDERLEMLGDGDGGQFERQAYEGAGQDRSKGETRAEMCHI